MVERKIAEAGLTEVGGRPVSRAHHHQAGQGAYHHRVPKSSSPRNQGLTDGIAGAGSRGRDRCTPESRFVGKETPGDAVPHGLSNAGPQKSTYGGMSGQRGGQNQGNRAGDPVPGAHKNHQTTQYIKSRHEWDQEATKPGNRADSTQNDRAGETGHGQPQPKPDRGVGLVESEDGFFHHHHLHNRIGLGHVADPEGRYGGEQGEQNTRPAGVKGALQDKHRTARHLTPGIGDPVFHGQESLGVFRGNPEDPGQPHPENRSRASH